MARIKAPVYGFLRRRRRANRPTLPETIQNMKSRRKTFEPVTYEAPATASMRAGEALDASEPNRESPHRSLGPLEIATERSNDGRSMPRPSPARCKTGTLDCGGPIYPEPSSGRRFLRAAHRTLT